MSASTNHDIAEPPPAPFRHVVAILFVIGAPIVGAVVAAASAWQHGWMGWLYLNLFLAGQFLTGLGISVGYHRLLTHRAFDASPGTRLTLMVLGALAVEGGPLRWCSAHRKHHQFSDDHGDPHSPLSPEPGLWPSFKQWAHAHVGWLFTGHLAFYDPDRYVPDLQRDPAARWIERFYDPVFVPLAFLIPAAIAGAWTGSWRGFWLGMLWGGLVRVFAVHHITFAVNSICHLFGTREYRTTDHSRNNAICALLAHGEGWHNNHHAFPSSARHGLHWWQIDTGYWVIRMLERLGLVWNVNRPSLQALERRRVEG